MKTRIITGAILAAVGVLIMVLQNDLVICGVVALIAAFMTYELIRALDLHKIYAFFGVSLLFSIALPFIFLSGYINILLFMIPLYFTLSMFFIIIDFSKTDMKQVGLFYTEYILLMVGCGAMTCLKLFYDTDGTYYIVMAMLFAFVTDMGAYFTGRAFGKHKLCPVISPNKTVEGSVGGVIISLIVCTLLTVAYDLWLTDEGVSINYYALAALILIASLSSMIGDLTASAIKRACGIKDFSKLLPGHGGMLDRMDSVIFTTPLTFGFIALFPIVIR